MIEVSLFVCLWATRFFFRMRRMLLLSQKKRVKTTIFSMKPRRFAVKRTRPRIRHPRMAKKICRMSAAFSDKRA